MRRIYVLSLDQPSRPLLGPWGVNGRQIISVLLGGLCVSRVALRSFLVLQRCLRSPREPSLNNRRFLPFPQRKVALSFLFTALPPGANMEGRLGPGETPRLQAGLNSLCRGVVGQCIGLHRNSQITD